MSGRDFWSRRKAAVAAETRAETVAAEAAAGAEALAAEGGRTDTEILEALELPDPDTLEAGDDFRAFLASAVPGHIRARALRRLWATNPVLANVDGLVDYGGDFTDAAHVTDRLQTAYQVGRGMTRHVDALARQAGLEADEVDAGEAEGDASATTDTAPADAAEADAARADAAEADAAPADAAQADAAQADAAPVADASVATEAPAPAADGETNAAPPPRRMRFRFDDTPLRETA